MSLLPETPAGRSADLIDFPHGTVSGVIDYQAGVLRLFSDPQAHPEDKALALDLAARMAGGTWTLYANADGCMSEVTIVPGAIAVVA